MFKVNKVLLISFFLLVIVTSIGLVSAGSFLEDIEITPFNEDTVVTIDGFNFTIPKGFGEDVNYTIDGEVEGEITTYERIYYNDDIELISISIFYDGSSIDLESLKDDANVYKTINGKKGLYESYGDSESPIYYFSYIEDNKVIMVNVNSQSYLDKIIM